MTLLRLRHGFHAWIFIMSCCPTAISAQNAQCLLWGGGISESISGPCPSTAPFTSWSFQISSKDAGGNIIQTHDRSVTGSGDCQSQLLCGGIWRMCVPELVGPTTSGSNLWTVTAWDVKVKFTGFCTWVCDNKTSHDATVLCPDCSGGGLGGGDQGCQPPPGGCGGHCYWDAEDCLCKEIGT